MRLLHSKTQATFLTLMILTFGIIDFFPAYGRPFFRYMGSDPRHFVWNFGWPMAWFIYDETNPPHWFDWVGESICLLFFAQGGVIAVCWIFLRMFRKKNPSAK